MPALRGDSIHFAKGRRSIHVEQFIRTEQRAGGRAPRGELTLVFSEFVEFGAVGGEEFCGVRAFGEEFVVLTSPLVEAPLATWTPLFTNLFDFYGTFNRTSRFISTESRRFYIIRQGGDNEPN